MDYIMDHRLIYRLRNGLPSTWMYTDLAGMVFAHPPVEIPSTTAPAPVEVPDFTRGAWNRLKGYRSHNGRPCQGCHEIINPSKSEVPKLNYLQR